MNRFEDRIKRVTVNPVIRHIGRVIDKHCFSGEPIFVVASPRSGTTLLLSMIGAHPHIFAVPEQTYAFARWTKVPFRRYQQYPYRIDRLYREFIFHGFDKSACRWCEKTPRHVESIENIAEFYDGKVKIIHLIRDGRDVAVSKHPKHRPDEYWVSPQRWTRSVKYGWSLRDKPYVHTVFYEDLVKDHKPHLHQICDFLEEPYTSSMDDWMHATNVQQSKHWGGSVQKVHTGAIGKWQKPEHKKRIEYFMKNDEAVALMKELGYLKDGGIQ